MKKSIALLLCLVMVFALSVVTFADNRVLTNINEMACAQRGNEDVCIYKAKLYEDGVNPTDIYLVVCEGMDFTTFDLLTARSITNATRIALSDEYNVYVREVVSMVLKYVPKGAKIVFNGRSMGGMVVEQTIAQKVIKDNYEVLYSLAIASPYIITKGCKEGTLRRFVDKADIVPYISIAGLANPTIGNVAIERSGYVLTVHMDGYIYGKCWQKYDALGVKNGKAKIELIEVVSE